MFMAQIMVYKTDKSLKPQLQNIIKSYRAAKYCICNLERQPRTNRWALMKTNSSKCYHRNLGILPCSKRMKQTEESQSLLDSRKLV